MQIPSVLPPIIQNPLPQDLVNKAVPTVQAVQPLVQHAVNPSPKGERSREHHDGDRSDRRNKKDPQQARKDGNDKEEHSVNISV